MTQTKTKPKARAGGRIRLLVIALGAAALVLVVLAIGGFGSSASPTAPRGDAAPQIEFQTFDGQTVTLADFQGTPVVLNFFASWCPACVAEMPELQAVHSKLGADRVTFVGVAMRDDADLAQGLRSRTGVTYEIFQDPDGLLYREFRGIAMPTTIFIDADGSVVGRHNGALFADDLEQKINELLPNA